MGSKNSIISVSILEYNSNDHCFYPDIQLNYNGPKDSLDSKGVEQSGVEQCAESAAEWHPSETWMNVYRQWNNFGTASMPQFDSAADVAAFNETGQRLEQLLRQEIEQQIIDEKYPFRMEVTPYKPLYSAIEVGTVTSWWHIRDANYPLVIPIQHLPVSQDLKMRLQAWRMRVAYDSFDKEQRKSFNTEGHRLEKEIFAELNSADPSESSHEVEIGAHYSFNNGEATLCQQEEDVIGNSLLPVASK